MCRIAVVAPASRISPDAADKVRAVAGSRRTGGDFKTAAFDVTILSQLLGMPVQPNLDGYVLMLEEVSEAMYRSTGRYFTSPAIPGSGGWEVARTWYDKSGIPWLGRADIGHDADNKIAPFGSSGR